MKSGSRSGTRQRNLTTSYVVQEPHSVIPLAEWPTLRIGQAAGIALAR